MMLPETANQYILASLPVMLGVGFTWLRLFQARLHKANTDLSNEREKSRAARFDRLEATLGNIHTCVEDLKAKVRDTSDQADRINRLENAMLDWSGRRDRRSSDRR